MFGREKGSAVKLHTRISGRVDQGNYLGDLAVSWPGASQGPGQGAAKGPAKGQPRARPRARPRASQGQAKGHPCIMDLVQPWMSIPEELQT